MEVNRLISKSLQEMPASRRQRALAKGDLSKLIHMGLNENNYGMSPKAMEALKDSMTTAHFYPDFMAAELKQTIAEFYGMEQENVLTGAGSSAMIDMLGLTFLDPGDEVLVLDGKGREALCRIIQIGKQSARLHVISKKNHPRPSSGVGAGEVY